MLLVFDWDGTLIDSAAKIISCMQTAAMNSDLPRLSDIEIKNIIGLGLPEAIQMLYPKAKEEQRLQLQQEYAKAFVAADHIPCDFFTGVEECLDLLQQQGHQVAVATGKSRKGLQRVLTNLNWLDKFDATRCADETASKPHPLMLIELMDELGFPKEETYMIGDTEYDLAMATNAQVNSIGVSYGAHAVDRLKKHSPLAIIDSLVQIPALIAL